MSAPGLHEDAGELAEGVEVARDEALDDGGVGAGGRGRLDHRRETAREEADDEERQGQLPLRRARTRPRAREGGTGACFRPAASRSSPCRIPHAAVRTTRRNPGTSPAR